MHSDITYSKGFFDEEKIGHEPFRWMSLEAKLGIGSEDGYTDSRFLEFQVLSAFYDLTQTLTITVGSKSSSFPLVYGWSSLSVELEPGIQDVSFELDNPYPEELHPGDTRRLGVLFKNPQIHKRAERHQAVLQQAVNGALNTKEVIEGKEVLESMPRCLGIDLHGVCNVKPPCVYCEWDLSKNYEGKNVNAPFTLETLDEYGPFFENCSELINCSIGEPFMMGQFDDLLDAFGNRSKMLEMSSNGQILTDKNIQRLLGRNIHLYVSLDAATASTYARLRNNTFDRILENLKRLISAKGGPGNLPFVYLVFMPMKANIHEVDLFVDLCAELNVDNMVLRPLNESDSSSLKWDRGGYHFDYQNELLPFDERVRIAGRVTERCEFKGVALLNQMDFGGELAGAFEIEFEKGRQETREILGIVNSETLNLSPDEIQASSESEDSTKSEKLPPPAPSMGREKLPACLEPWNRLYILRRGVLPCCYGHEPIAEMSQYKETWNGPIMREIRSALARGEFHEYCLNCKACPVVQKAQHSGSLSSDESSVIMEEEEEPIIKPSLAKRLSDFGRALVGAKD